MQRYHLLKILLTVLTLTFLNTSIIAYSQQPSYNFNSTGKHVLSLIPGRKAYQIVVSTNQIDARNDQQLLVIDKNLMDSIVSMQVLENGHPSRYITAVIGPVQAIRPGSNRAPTRTRRITLKANARAKTANYQLRFIVIDRRTKRRTSVDVPLSVMRIELKPVTDTPHAAGQLELGSGTPSKRLTISPEAKTRTLKRPLSVRYNGQFDVDQLFLIHYAPNGTRQSTTITHDLTPDSEYACPRAASLRYNKHLDINILPLHDPCTTASPSPYYFFEYREERIASPSCTPVYWEDTTSTKSFSVGRNRLGDEYQLLNETMIIYGRTSIPSSRFVQIYRGPGTQLYLYTPGQSYAAQPVVLQEGQLGFHSSDFNNATPIDYTCPNTQ